MQRSARNCCAAGLFWANFQMDRQPIRCSSPIRPCGPAGIGQIQRLSEYCPPAAPLSGVRVAEIAFKMSEAVPEERELLFPAAFPFQLKMSFVSPVWAISAMNLTPSIRFFERIVRRFLLFWMKLPRDIRKA